MHSPSSRLPGLPALYVQVLIAVVIGATAGHFYPGTATAMKPLADGFIRLVKLVVAPIVFCTVVHGLASMSDLRQLGRLGFKALLYFEIVSTVALIIGLAVVNFTKPGDGFHVDPKALEKSAVEKSKSYATQSHNLTPTEFLLNIIPTTFAEAFVKGDILQILFLAVLTALALSAMGDAAAPLIQGVDVLSQLFFAVMRCIVNLAPLGAFGAMALTVGSQGLGSLGHLAKLMGGFYLTALLFVLVVLGTIARIAGFPLLGFLRYLREELLLVLGTSSSETALPGLMRKLKGLGCKASTVGVVVPMGYSFNLDGTNIYLTMAAVFLAQATDTPLSLREQLSLLGVAMLSSKGASGVTGAGFVVLAATLAVVPQIPTESIALLVGIDRFMSECRALVNLIGNGVAAIVVSRWEGEISGAEIRAGLAKAASDSTNEIPSH